MKAYAKYMHKLCILFCINMQMYAINMTPISIYMLEVCPNMEDILCRYYAEYTSMWKICLKICRNMQ